MSSAMWTPRILKARAARKETAEGIPATPSSYRAGRGHVDDEGLERKSGRTESISRGNEVILVVVVHAVGHVDHKVHGNKSGS